MEDLVVVLQMTEHLIQHRLEILPLLVHHKDLMVV
tara:strand:+ start:214 stop:318 length:105 start_codon:yes stop_codon:yes gene_type:complete